MGDRRAETRDEAAIDRAETARAERAAETEPLTRDRRDSNYNWPAGFGGGHKGW